MIKIRQPQDQSQHFFLLSSANSDVAAHDTGKPKSKEKKRLLPSQSNDHTHRQSLNLNILFHPPYPFPAPVCGAAAATAGHPEPSQPPVSAGTGARRSAVRPAQVAAVHPVQDGSGGDPVVGGRLAVLPHVTCSPLCSRRPVHSGSSNLRASPPAEATKTKKEKGLHWNLLRGENIWTRLGFFLALYIVRTCTVNLFYLKVRFPVQPRPVSPCGMMMIRCLAVVCNGLKGQQMKKSFFLSTCWSWWASECLLILDKYIYIYIYIFNLWKSYYITF